MSLETLAIVALCLAGGSVALRLVAPVVTRRWPGSWLDVVVASLLRLVPEILGFALGILNRQGSASPLVPPKVDRAAVEAAARSAYEGIRQSDMPLWDDLPAAERRAWTALAGQIKATSKQTVALAATSVRRRHKGSSMPPLPPVLVLLFVACTPQERGAVKTGVDAAVQIAVGHPRDAQPRRPVIPSGHARELP